MIKTPSTSEKLDAVRPECARHPSFSEAFLFWLKLGFISFGGPTGQIAIMHAELVEKRKWISEARFLHALNYCMLLPGPEAQQLATYVGWLLHKTWGGIVAGAFFIIPSIFILWALSYIYVAFGTIPWIAAIFYGLKPAVLAIVAAAVIRIGSRALKNEVMWTLSAAAFVVIFFLHVPFPLIVSSAAAIGYLGGKWKPDKFLVIRGHGKTNSESVLDDTSAVPDHAKPAWPRAVRVALVWTMTFTPCFLWIFLGGPYIESLRGNEALATALSAVTAAVVGVVLNLALWFGLHVIFPGNGMVDWFAIVVSTVTFIGMVRWKWDIVPVVLVAGLAGLISRTFAFQGF